MSGDVRAQAAGVAHNAGPVVQEHRLVEQGKGGSGRHAGNRAKGGVSGDVCAQAAGVANDARHVVQEHRLRKTVWGCGKQTREQTGGVSGDIHAQAAGVRHNAGPVVQEHRVVKQEKGGSGRHAGRRADRRGVRRHAQLVWPMMPAM